MAEEQARTAPAAYLPFKTFLSAVEMLQQGLPKRLDRTVWRSQSGVVQSQIMMAFRFFGLVNDAGEPTPALKRLVESPDKRKEHVGALLNHAYKSIVDHDLTAMTPKMLEEAMGDYNVSGDTRRKAIGFFLRAARFAEIPMHPLLAAQIREAGNGARNRRIQSPKSHGTARESGDAGSMSGTSANSRTIRLNSGGSVTLEVDANPFMMSPEDRTFVFELVDMLQKYSGLNSEGKDRVGKGEVQWQEER